MVAGVNQQRIQRPAMQLQAQAQPKALKQSEAKPGAFEPNSKVSPQQKTQMERLLPGIQSAAEKYGVDPKKLAGVVMQESGGKNYLNHSKEQGGFGLKTDRGLVGLNENGKMPDFEKAVGEKFGRAATNDQKLIPEQKQLDFLAKTLSERSAKFGGDVDRAIREWHAGGNTGSTNARNYGKSVNQHIQNLFPNGQFPAVTKPSAASRYYSDSFEAAAA